MKEGWCCQQSLMVTETQLWKKVGVASGHCRWQKLNYERRLALPAVTDGDRNSTMKEGWCCQRSLMVTETQLWKKVGVVSGHCRWQKLNYERRLVLSAVTDGDRNSTMKEDWCCQRSLMVTETQLWKKIGVVSGHCRWQKLNYERRLVLSAVTDGDRNTTIKDGRLQLLVGSGGSKISVISWHWCRQKHNYEVRWMSSEKKGLWRKVHGASFSFRPQGVHLPLVSDSG